MQKADGNGAAVDGRVRVTDGEERLMKLIGTKSTNNGDSFSESL
ncbi:hypothetical protein [Paenibacillus tianmuensis]|nr:hypothetical protein [Paenibacillus tianmuensis]